MRQIVITEKEAGQRLDKMLSRYLNEAPPSFLYKMLRKKNIKLNGKKAAGNEKLAVGDTVTVYLADATVEKFSKNIAKERGKGKPVRLDIIYEDAHILLLNKPVGMLSQKAERTDVSAVEYVTSYLLESGQITAEGLRTFHPAVCNRLDRNTSGLLAAGKTMAGLQELSRMFKERTIGKYYLCLAVGTVTESSAIRGFLRKNEKTNQVEITKQETPGSAAIETEYRPLQAVNGATLLEVHLITGKTHQIRAHLASVGHQIVGDFKYGDKKVNARYKQEYGLTHQLLHAYRMQFPTVDGTLSYLSGKEFCAELPEEFRQIIG